MWKPVFPHPVLTFSCMIHNHKRATQVKILLILIQVSRLSVGLEKKKMRITSETNSLTSLSIKELVTFEFVLSFHKSPLIELYVGVLLCILQ